jgi:hypothetical protein
LSQNEQIADSRIQSGIELGNLIEAALYLKKQSAVNSPSDAAATLAETTGVLFGIAADFFLENLSASVAAASDGLLTADCC